MEVVNTAMRSLLEAAQTATAPSTPKAGALSLDLTTKKPKRLPATTASGAKVLQSRSVNRNDKPAVDLDSLDHLALCCSMATTFLQSLEAGKGIPESKPLQTENTRSILATKLMQLRKYKFALNEWKKLKRRLEELIQQESGVESRAVTDESTPPIKTVKKSASTSKISVSKDGGSLEDEADHDGTSRVLEFPQTPSSSPLLPLVIVCQLGILRCISGLKRPDMVEVRPN